MDRFAAMIWDPRAERSPRHVEMWRAALQQCPTHWRLVFESQGVCVFSRLQRGPEPVATSWEDDQGIVLGVLFERGQEHKGRVKRLDQAASNAITRSQGARLTEGYWGNYLALWRNSKDERVCVLRDPCGALGCFMTRQHGVELLFSHAEDAAALPGVRFSIDWTFLRAFTLFNYFVTAQTGLLEVEELLPGQCVTLNLGDEAKREFRWVWNGAEYAARPDRRSFEHARLALREVGETCARAWGKEYHRLVVSASGGLDSSILLNLFARYSDAELVGLHYLGVGYERYEVEFARLAARHAGVALIEAVQDPTRERLTPLLHAPRLVRPKIQSLALLIDELSLEAAERFDADAFMIGQGGDNLFLQQAGARHVLADYVRHNGLGADFFNIAYDAATLEQNSIWSVAAQALSHSLVSSPWRPFRFLDQGDWAELRPFHQGALDSIPKSYMRHPWHEDAADLPHGKADQLASVIALQAYHMHFGRGLERDVLYPFVSQPLVELALQLPTYTLCQGGHDRALERAAFADIVPEPILRRTAKGGANFYLLQVMEQNLSIYRRLILDGELIKQDWLDRARVEAMLTPGFIANGAGAAFIYLLVAVEAWLHTWRTPSSQAAAA